MSNSPHAREAHRMVTALQTRFVSGLEQIQGAEAFEETSWLRDEGRHGGGSRFSTGSNSAFNRASVNVSQVHYDDDPTKKLGSATAISTIIHPGNPHAPSIHLHISWTEMKDTDETKTPEGVDGYWRIMADLNPSIEYKEDSLAFKDCLKSVAPDQYREATEQGDRYFYIPACQRHRGVAHFYLENYRTSDPREDHEFARCFGEAVIDCYLEILQKAIATRTTVSESDRSTQLAYHTLYFFQVLTLDRGTTSGLLVHNQNDTGIMGSLPSHVDKALLSSWRSRLPAPQEQLLDDLLDVLPDDANNRITTEIKQNLAQAVRNHYRKFPEALKLQASGDVIPPTVENHR